MCESTTRCTTERYRPSSNAERARRYRQKLKARVYALFSDDEGTFCHGPDCGTREGPLELAHVRATGLCSAGRGQIHRHLDVMKYPDHYTLLCKECHRNENYPAMEEAPF